jgi:hypothetical protein
MQVMLMQKEYLLRTTLLSILTVTCFPVLMDIHLYNDAFYYGSCLTLF